MRAYSSALRERVLKAVDQGYHRNDIIRLFGVSRATINRYLKQWRETATIQARSHPGRPAKKSVALRERMGQLVQERSDARLEDYCQIWEPRWGGKVSSATMSRAMRSAGDTRKKRQWQRANRTSRSCSAWKTQAEQLDAERLVIVDESGSHLAFPPRDGWGPKGARVRGSVPRNRGKNMTLIASLCWSGMGEGMMIEGSTNASAFERYVEEILSPRLRAGQIVIMANLSAHKGKKILALIEARGCQLLFLPSYSPDFSPIEETFSKLKACLRRAGARTREELQEAIGQALLTVTAQDAQGWFRHCGYLPAQGRV